eukprot:8038483-Pyramimonas_sp.AAC.1
MTQSGARCPSTRPPRGILRIARRTLQPADVASPRSTRGLTSILRAVLADPPDARDFFDDDALGCAMQRTGADGGHARRRPLQARCEGAPPGCARMPEAA